VAGPGTSERRSRILRILRHANGPTTGSELSSTLGVSRQAIVNDVAVLRAAGEPIKGSPAGYVYAVGGKGASLIACQHDREGSRDELLTLVDHGVEVLDVVVEHALYGEVRANLMIATHEDAESYLDRLLSGDIQPLSALTGGIHLHHVRAERPEDLDAARKALSDRGILLD
jgi:transcriptional regulator of NAD metabolism